MSRDLRETPLPVDRVARRVTAPARPENLWEPRTRTAPRGFSKEVLPIASLPPAAPKELYRLIGCRRDRLMVIGYAADQDGAQSARWVVRCDCGNYENRTRIIRWLGTQAPDMCAECRNRVFKKNRSESPWPREKAQRQTLGEQA